MRLLTKALQHYGDFSICPSEFLARLQALIATWLLATHKWMLNVVMQRCLLWEQGPRAVLFDCIQRRGACKTFFLTYLPFVLVGTSYVKPSNVSLSVLVEWRF